MTWKLRGIAIAATIMVATVAAFAVGMGHHSAVATGCATANPLYAAVAGDGSIKTDWYFAGVAGPAGNGYTGTMYVSIFDPDAGNTPVTANVFEYQELASATQTLNFFSEGATLQANRSTTLAFNGLPPRPGDTITVPSGKVHFHVQATAPVNVYAEQWLSC